MYLDCKGTNSSVLFNHLQEDYWKKQQKIEKALRKSF
jgi:hypothetical protein